MELYGLRYNPSAVMKRAAEELRYASYSKALRIYQAILSGPTPDNDIAFLCCNDRYFLFVFVLRRLDGLHPWLYARCREVEEEPDNCLDLWARGHYKSSIITFAGSIQEIIRDPNITIGIFSITAYVARRFVKQIKDEVEGNERLRALFPDVFHADPGNDAPLWSVDKGLIVIRTVNPKEPTVSGYGLLEAMPTGSHFRLRDYDDIINESVVTQTATDQIRKITERWELSQNLGDGRLNRKWTVGTRYLYSDTYADLISRGILKLRLHPATHNGKLDGRPVFLLQEEWDRIKNEQRSTVAAQMLQNPLATADSTFRMVDLRPYALRPRILNVYILVDPSLGKSRKADRTAIVVIGVDLQGHRYLLDGYCHQMRMSERYENLKALHDKWMAAPGVQNVKVGYERYGMQVDLEYIEEKLVAANSPMVIEEVNWTNENDQSKRARVSRLEPYFRNGKFHLPPLVWMPVKGECWWYVDPETEQIVYEAMGPERRFTKAEIAARERGEAYRIMRPLTRLDHDRQMYDLTRILMEEYQMHPYSPRDDLIDATSRIQDVDPAPPMVVRHGELDPLEVTD